MIGQRLLGALYDPIAAASLRETVYAPRIVALAGPNPRRICHVGCGRGWLAIDLARAYPDAEVIGLDCDEGNLGGARHSAQRAGVELSLHRGLAQDGLPGDKPIDCVVSSLLFHHLTRAEKRATLAHAATRLTAGGRLLLADFGAPHDRLMRAAFLGVQLAHGFEDTADNLRDRYPALMRDAGFKDVSEVGRWRSILGTVALWSATAV